MKKILEGRYLTFLGFSGFLGFLGFLSIEQYHFLINLSYLSFLAFLSLLVFIPRDETKVKNLIEPSKKIFLFFLFFLIFLIFLVTENQIIAVNACLANLSYLSISNKKNKN